MIDLRPEHFGKSILMTGIIISIIGVLLLLFSYLGIFRLPGDLEWAGKNWKVFIPIVSCLIISAILTLIFGIIRYFLK